MQELWVVICILFFRSQTGGFCGFPWCDGCSTVQLIYLSHTALAAAVLLKKSLYSSCWFFSELVSASIFFSWVCVITALGQAGCVLVFQHQLTLSLSLECCSSLSARFPAQHSLLVPDKTAQAESTRLAHAFLCWSRALAFCQPSPLNITFFAWYECYGHTNSKARYICKLDFQTCFLCTTSSRWSILCNNQLGHDSRDQQLSSSIFI